MPTSFTLETRISRQKYSNLTNPSSSAWCGPCRAIAPVYEKLSEEYQGKLNFAKMDTDEHQQVPYQYHIQAIPTLIIFNQGREIGRLIGPHPTRLKNEIDKVLTDNGVGAA